MKLSFTLNTFLPKLLWIAQCNSDSVSIIHGPCVEKNDDFLMVGAWAGGYDSGDFDRTDLIVGTGIRFRNNEVIFVTPGNTLDRLVYCFINNTLYVSNSLPGLLATTKLELVEGYDYSRDFETIKKGIKKCQKSIPTKTEKIDLLYFKNLIYSSGKFYEVDKPNSSPAFTCFNEYYEFLLDTIQSIDKNATSSSRQHKITKISTISSGYDATVASILAKNVGCNKFFTIVDEKSHLPRSDSGEPYAKYLNIHCEKYYRKAKNYRDETATWAATGTIGDLHLTNFDYPEPLSLMFSGFHGDKIWDRQYHALEEIQRGDISGSRFAEFRLRTGVILLPVPFLGIQNAKMIQDISFSDEMKPWSVFNNYDRPIARRIAESEGIPRKIFAKKKRASSFAWETPKPYPLSKSLRAEFIKYAQSKAQTLPSKKLIIFWEILNGLHWRMHGVKINFSFFDRTFKSWDPFPNRWFFFHWANDKLKSEYATHLGISSRQT